MDSGIDIIKLNKNITMTMMRVFLQIVKTMEFGNTFILHQSELAEELEMKQPQVSLAVKKLIKEGMISKQNSSRSCRTYIVNPEISWKGDMERIKRKSNVISLQTKLSRIAND